MTVRNLINKLTESFVDLDAEVYVSVAKVPIENKGIPWEDFKIDRCSLHTPDWYIGDRCCLVVDPINK